MTSTSDNSINLMQWQRPSVMPLVSGRAAANAPTEEATDATTGEGALMGLS